MYYLGIDLGTSSMEAILSDENGKVIDNAKGYYSLEIKGEGKIEQHPNLWVKAFEEIMEALRSNNNLFSENLKSICISGQMHSLVCLNSEGSVIRNAILWNDTRTTKQCRYIEDKLKDTLFSITGNKALEGFTLPKLLWLKDNEIDTYSKIDKIMMPKDYLNYYLTGVLATDYSDASGTLLLDINEKKWSKKVIDTFNIKPSIVPEIIQAGHKLGDIKTELQEKYNLKNTVKVIMGGADNASSALGCGIVNKDTAMVSIGTSGTVLAITNACNEKGLHHFLHVIPNTIYSMGVTLSAGKSLEWAKSLLYKNESYDQMLNSLDFSKLKNDSLYFTPYLMGERTPYADSKIRSSFIGLDAMHSRENLINAVLEGITYSLNDCLNLVKSEAEIIRNITSVGGGAKNKEWIKMQSSIFNNDVSAINVGNACANGSLILSLVEDKCFNAYDEAIRNIVTVETIQTQNILDLEIYRKKYNIYRKLYKITSEINK